eukprot:jgi/Mesen1/7407/ME000388S06626
MKVDEDLAVSPGVSSLMGALAGSVEVIIQQPLVAWKNAVQDARPVPLDPRLLYRGVVVNACSMAPINGLQFGVNRYLEEKRVTFAVFILGEAKERLTDIYLHVEKYRSKGVLLTLETES